MKIIPKNTRSTAEALEAHLLATGLRQWRELASLINAAGVPQRRLGKHPGYGPQKQYLLFGPERDVNHFLPLSRQARRRIVSLRDQEIIGKVLQNYLKHYSRTSLRSALENVRALCKVVVTALRPGDTGPPPSLLSWESITLVMSLPIGLLDHETAERFLALRTAAAERLRGPDQQSAKRTANSIFRKGRILLNDRLFPRYLEEGISLPPEAALFHREELPKVPPPVYEAPALPELRAFFREVKRLEKGDPTAYKVLAGALGAGMRKGEVLHVKRDSIVTWTKTPQVILQASEHHELKSRTSRAALSYRTLLKRLLSLTDPHCKHLVAERHKHRLAAYEKSLDVLSRHLGEVAGRKQYHYLRRFYATAIGLLEKDLGKAQQSVGHANLDTTFRSYFLRGFTVKHLDLWIKFLAGQ